RTVRCGKAEVSGFRDGPGGARFDFSAPKSRALKIAVPLARNGIAAHVALPSRKVLRGAIPARSGAPHGPSRNPETSTLPHLPTLTRRCAVKRRRHRNRASDDAHSLVFGVEEGAGVEVAP